MAFRVNVLAFLQEHRNVTNRFVDLLHQAPLGGIRALYADLCRSNDEDRRIALITALLGDASDHLVATIRLSFPAKSPTRRALCKPGPIAHRGAFLVRFRSVSHLSEFAIGTRKTELENAEGKEREVAPVTGMDYESMCLWLKKSGADPFLHRAAAESCEMSRDFIFYQACPIADEERSVVSCALIPWDGPTISKRSPPPFPPFPSASASNAMASVASVASSGGLSRTVLSKGQRKRAQLGRVRERKKAAESERLEPDGFPCLKQLTPEAHARAVEAALDVQPGEL